MPVPAVVGVIYLAETLLLKPLVVSAKLFVLYFVTLDPDESCADAITSTLSPTYIMSFSGVIFTFATFPVCFSFLTAMALITFLSPYC